MFRAFLAAAWYHLSVDIAFKLFGNINIYTFSLVSAFGAMVGLAAVAWLADDDARSAHLNAGLWALAGVLIGARMLFVAFQWPYYQSRLADIVSINLGGLSWAGALLGGIAAIWMYARFSKKLFAEVADYLIPLFAALSISSWLGCWLSGCAYGHVSTSWWALPAVDEWGVVDGRVPTHLLAMLLIAAVFWVIYSNSLHMQSPGQAASLFLIGFSLSYFMITYLRSDLTPVSAGLRWDAWGALAFGAFGLVSYINLRSANQ